MNFVWPWAFFLLPLPFFIRWLWPSRSNQQATLRVASLEPWQAATQETHERWSDSNLIKGLQLLLPTLLWCCLVVSLARPYQTGEVVELPNNGRDMILAVDISPSMNIDDMTLGQRQTNRLSVVKHVVSDFVRKRTGDRMGLVLFANEAYLQVPLTFDTRTVNILLDEAQIGLAGKKTAIGDAITLTVKRLLNHQENSRVIILLTDGDNTAGEIDPIKAAELAASHHVKIYTIGFGAERMEVSSFFGSRTVNPSKDLDEKTLKTIAEKTQGAYFRARDAVELERIYAAIDSLEPTLQDPEPYRPEQHLYYWPLLAALALSFLIALQTCLPSIATRQGKRA